FQVGFEHPDWYNGFEHDPEEAARVRVRLLRELAANREALAATHLAFPSVCHAAADGDVFRWVPRPRGHCSPSRLEHETEKIGERGEAMKIVVIGGTGLIGSKVVAKLKQKGHEVIAASPNTGVNTITGEGLAEALAGAQVVVDLANSPSFEDKAV